MSKSEMAKSCLPCLKTECSLIGGHIGCQHSYLLLLVIALVANRDQYPPIFSQLTSSTEWKPTTAPLALLLHLEPWIKFHRYAGEFFELWFDFPTVVWPCLYHKRLVAYRGMHFWCRDKSKYDHKLTKSPIVEAKYTAVGLEWLLARCLGDTSRPHQ